MVQQRIDSHTLKVLEFDGVQALLASFANSGLGKDAALVFSTGMQVNLGAISALVGPKDVVIIDKDNHASNYVHLRKCMFHFT